MFKLVYVGILRLVHRQRILEIDKSCIPRLYKRERGEGIANDKLKFG